MSEATAAAHRVRQSRLRDDIAYAEGYRAACEEIRKAGEGQELMGYKEIRTLLGVGNTRMHQLKARPGYPQPIARLAMGPVYDGATVRAWAATRKES